MNVNNENTIKFILQCTQTYIFTTIMLFDFNFYSSLLLIFFVHSLVYSILLFIKGFQNQTSADKWLACFLLLCTLYISPWMLGFAGWYENQPYRDIIFYIPFQHLFGIGPIIFFYTQSLLNSSFRFGRKEFIHFIPSVLYLLYSLIVFVTDKLVLHEYYFLADGADRDFDTWYQFTGFVSMLIYFVASLRYYFLYKKIIVQFTSNAEEMQFSWIKNFLFAFLSMQILQVFFYFLLLFFPARNFYMGSWWYYFSFSLIFYYIAIRGYSNSIETKVHFRVDLLENKEDLLFEESEKIEEITETEITPTQDALILAWKEKLWDLMENQKAYQNPELSLTQVAKSLKTNPALISKVVNQGFEQNFNDFVNYFRIEAVKNKIAAGEHEKQTLLGIAYDCGFNSKATFNRAFKKMSGISPKDFISSNS